MLPQRLVWLLLPLGWVVACGGRYERSADDGDAGGRAGGAGASAPSRAGVPSGGSAGTGAICPCAPIACAPGYKTVPKGCCFECVLDLEACVEQRQLYVEFREETVRNQSLNGCMTAADCSLFEDLTHCAPACSFVIPNSARRGIDDRLYARAEELCNPDCPPEPAIPCMTRPAPQCVAGRCQ